MSAANRPPAAFRLGVVSFLNSKPLMAGLADDPRFSLIQDVPARLPALLDRGEVDAALVPVVDLLHRDRTWQIVSDACISSDGPTLTVQVHAQRPAEQVTQLAVDRDSHTSVALAHVLWRAQHGQTLELLPPPTAQTSPPPEAVLLIGDKVVRAPESPVRIDLGEAWKAHTGLPFVFAVWAARRDGEVAELAHRLSQARDRGVQQAQALAEQYGPSLGWPVPLAVEYLTRNLQYTLGAQQRLGLARFYELVQQHGLPEHCLETSAA